MKFISPLSAVIAVLAGLWPVQVDAQVSATITENRVNVRGLPSLDGEVITQLSSGEKVLILEEIPVERPKPGEPSKWAKIRMPENTPVWVSTLFIDPAAKTVNASRLNLRAGPGENHNVVGRVERGAAVKEIRSIDTWMEIETPDDAYAFVAADLLVKDQAASRVEAAASETPDPTVVNAEPPPQEPAPQPQAPLTTEVLPADQLPKTPVDTGATTENKQPVSPPPPEEPEPLVVPAQLDPAVRAGADAQATPEKPPRRIVRREGIVRSTRSLQAPTYFELISPNTRETINYLHTTDPELALKEFKGKRIVVTGEEGIDPRWPSRPVLMIDTIEVLP